MSMVVTTLNDMVLDLNGVKTDNCVTKSSILVPDMERYQRWSFCLIADCDLLSAVGFGIKVESKILILYAAPAKYRETLKPP